MDTHKLCGGNRSLDLLQSGYISPCFIHLWLACPIHAVLVAVSVFFIAKHQSNPTCSLQKLMKTNQLLSALVVLVIVTQIACSVAGLQTYHPTSYFLSLAFIAFAWLLTSIYMQMNNRPPLMLCVLLALSWGTTITEFSTLIIRSDYNNEHINNKLHRVEDYSTIVRLLFQTLALAISVILRVKWISNEFVNQRLHTGIQAEASETDRLLGSEDYHVYYSGLSKQQSTEELNKVDENSDLLSRTTFWWVYKLMKKGLEGKLKNAEDLFYLPSSLSTKEIAVAFNRILQTLRKSLRRDSTSDDGSQGKQGNLKKRLLLRALHKAFGVRYYSIGILKFVGDCLGFAGPLLLHALVSFMENKNVSVEGEANVTDRQTDITNIWTNRHYKQTLQTYGQTDITNKHYKHMDKQTLQTDGQTNRHYKQMYGQTDITNRWTDKQTLQTDGWTNRHYKQMDGQTDITNRWTNRH